MKVIGISLIVFMVLLYGAMALYLWKGWFHRLFHDAMGWHQPDNHPHTFDGCSEHAKCKWCGEDIMQDSQGNWF